MIKAVFFDFDGVLVDSINLGLEVNNEICRKFGGQICSDVNQFKRANLLYWKKRYLESGVDLSQNEAEIRKVFRDYIVDNFHKIGLRKGMDQVLKELVKTSTLAVISYNYKGLIEKTLQKHGLKHLFTEITGDENDASKTERLNLLLRKFGLKKEEVLFVGDMLDDIRAGKETGVKTLIFSDEVAWNHKEDLLKHNPDVLINKAEDILEVIKNE